MSKELPSAETIGELAARSLVPAEKKLLGVGSVKSATVVHAGNEWLVCRAPQDGSCARLLDVAMSIPRKPGVPCLAILERPPDTSRTPGITPAYLHAYQGIAWRAFRVAFVPEASEREFAPAPLSPPSEVRAEFKRLAEEIHVELRNDARTTGTGSR